MYMLDTNIVSYLIKGKSPVLEQKMQFLPMNQICISVITRAELLYGLARMPQATRLANEVYKFLNYIHVLDWDIETSNTYAHTRADLEKRGQIIGSLDILIASHALAKDLILVTNNTAEFKRVHGLKYEDWTQ